jgi:hypothetical protein
MENEPKRVGSRKHLLFYLIFFGAIGCSIFFTYYQMYVLKGFHVFTEDEEIPEAVDFYKNFFEAIHLSLRGDS